MCGHGEHHEHHEHHHGGGECCCCCEGEGHGLRRRFSTREERIARLEEYLKDLQAEVTAVEEHLSELKAGR